MAPHGSRRFRAGGPERTAANDARIANGQGNYTSGVWVNSSNPDIVYTIATAAFISTDGGNTFTGWKGAPGGDDPQVLWIDPTDGKRMFMGLDQGGTVSQDGGDNWSLWYNQPTAQIYHISVDNSWPYWIYGTQQDACAIRHSRSRRPGRDHAARLVAQSRQRAGADRARSAQSEDHLRDST